MLSLGPVIFSDFEIPEKVSFGGGQKLVIHQMPGGGRIIDAMGPDDAPVRWSGIMSGPTAADRARMLDALRVAGNAMPLSWDAFFYTAIIERLDLDYRNPWWIPYRIRCTVAQNAPVATTSSALDLASAILGDIAVAGSLLPLAGVGTALAATGAMTLGTPAYANAQAALGSAGATLGAQLSAAEAGLQSSDVATMVAASGSLAHASAAQDYLSRATANLDGASS